MTPKNLTILCSAAILSMATASAELTLPINLDFEEENVLKDLQKSKDFSIFVNPKMDGPGIEVVEDSENPGNKVLEIRSNGASQANRLKINLPPMAQDFEYQFRCKVEGETVPGFRSLLNFYVKGQWEKPVRVLIPYHSNNQLHTVEDGKFKSTRKKLDDWSTIKVAVHTDGKAETPDTCSIFVNDEKVLADFPLEVNLGEPLDVAEIALDFENPDDVTKVKYLIDDIRVGSPTL